MFRMNPVRSPRRIAQTANWQVNELMIRITVRPAANHGSAWRLKCSVERLVARHDRRPDGAAARTLK